MAIWSLVRPVVPSGPARLAAARARLGCLTVDGTKFRESGGCLPGY